MQPDAAADECRRLPSPVSDPRVVASWCRKAQLDAEAADEGGGWRARVFHGGEGGIVCGGNASYATFIVVGTEDMWRRPPLVNGPARVDMNLTPFEVSSLPSGDSGLIGGLKG